MYKILKGKICLQLPAQGATPGLSLGPILGQWGLNIVQFCKDFNQRTLHVRKGVIINLKLTIYDDKTYDYEFNELSVVALLKERLHAIDNLDTKMPLKLLYEFALLSCKRYAYNTPNTQSIVRQLVGYCRTLR